MHRTQTYTAKLSPAVHERLTVFMEQQRLLYNAALEERIGAYRKAGQSIDRDGNAALTILNRGLPESPPSGGKTPRGATGGKNGRRRSSRIEFPKEGKLTHDQADTGPASDLYWRTRVRFSVGSWSVRAVVPV